MEPLWRPLVRDNPQNARALSRCGTGWKCTCWIADSKGYGWRTAGESFQGRRRRGESDRREGMKRRRGAEGDKMWRSWTARHGAAPSRRVYWSQGAERFNLPLATVRAMLPSGARGLARWLYDGVRWTPAKSSRLPAHPVPQRGTPTEIILRSVRRCVSRGGRSHRQVTPAFYVTVVTSCNPTGVQRAAGKHYRG